MRRVLKLQWPIRDVQVETKSWTFITPLLISLWMWAVPGRRYDLREWSFLQHRYPHRGLTAEGFLLEALPAGVGDRVLLSWKGEMGILQSPYMLFPSHLLSFFGYVSLCFLQNLGKFWPLSDIFLSHYLLQWYIIRPLDIVLWISEALFIILKIFFFLL